jgi:hypothetical protein
MTNATVLKMPGAVARPKKKSKVAVVAQQQLVASAGVAAVTLGLMGLSLTHLSRGIELVTGTTSSESWTMAVGIDVGFVALEAAKVAAEEKVRKIVNRWISPTIFGTVVASAGLNALAFAQAATGWMIYPAAALGVAIPMMIFAESRVATAMWIKR